MQRSSTFAFILFFTYSTWAKSKPPIVRRHPAANVENLQATLIYGERTTRYTIYSGTGKDMIAVISSTGMQKQRPVSPADKNYIADEFLKLPQAPKIPDSCYRNRVDITMKLNGVTKQKASCVGIQTITEPAYVHFLNILGAPF